MGAGDDQPAVDARPGDDGGLPGPDALQPDAAPPDGDHDGVPDATDNCPAVGNATQDDEDGDGVGDVCDNCPHVGNADQASADGDGVGDVCDPDPATGGDTIAFFDGFNGTSLADGWLVGSGDSTWSVSGGALHQTSAAPGQRILYWNSLTAADVTIDVEIKFADIPPGAPQDDTRTAGVVASYVASDTGGAGRGVIIGDYVNSLAAAWTMLGSVANGGLTYSNWGYLNDALSEDTYQLRAHVAPGTQYSIVTEPSGDGTKVDDTQADIAAGHVGLRTLNVAIDVPYVVVFGHEP
ncbi:MAG: thrombospondin type 3 repeat-containing protein [Kofleriaceae bacterium]|nr:thrombospondin type 3 repeat-containing protein [Kofleriaceae bacterium]MCB9571176.1 thrombospondin type 3 repeat-containing protein [Kofleriaceae bacterium]